MKYQKASSAERLAWLDGWSFVMLGAPPMGSGIAKRIRNAKPLEGERAADTLARIRAAYAAGKSEAEDHKRGRAA